MDHDAFVTIGDHFIEKTELEAMAAHFNIDAGALWLEGVQNELCLAHGRARDPSRTTPCLHIHYGKVWPAGWSLENASRVAPAGPGRPKKVPLKADTARQALAHADGNASAAARALGMARTTFGRLVA